MKFLRKKSTKLVAIISAVSLFSGAVGYAAGEWENIWVQFDSVNLLVNGQNVTSANLLYNDRTYVPLRACAEMLGGTVGWDQNSSTASINTNSTGSTDTAKIIKDMQAIAILMDRLDSTVILSGYLDYCYSNCVNFSNFITASFTNLEEKYNSDIDSLNATIEYYNECISYLDDLTSNANIIGLDFSQASEMFESYGKCIDNLKTAYEKLILYYETNDKQYDNEAETLWTDASNNISDGDKLRRESSSKIV